MPPPLSHTRDVLPGTMVLQRYVVLDKIAQGGMADVYLAREIVRGEKGELVVIKKVKQSFTRDKSFVDMFVNEARVAALLQHPNVVAIRDLGEDDQSWAIAMEYLDGRDMLHMGRACRDAKRPIPYNISAMVLAEACKGLSYAHAKNGPDGTPLHLVHRDMSPENILITFDGRVKVVDFGIAKAKDNAYQTKTGQIKGKLGYVSPEAILGKELDGRSDIFAVGSSLYLFLTGQSAFSGDSPVDVFENTLKKPTPPHKVNPEVPRELSDICMKCLAVKKSKRYQDAADVARDLEAFLTPEANAQKSKVLTNFMSQLFPASEDERRLKIRSLMQHEDALLAAFLEPDDGPADKTRIGMPSYSPDAVQTKLDGKSEKSLNVDSNAGTPASAKADATRFEVDVRKIAKHSARDNQDQDGTSTRTAALTRPPPFLPTFFKNFALAFVLGILLFTSLYVLAF